MSETKVSAAMVTAYLAALNPRAIAIIASRSFEEASVHLIDVDCEQTQALDAGRTVFHVLWFEHRQHAELLHAEYLDNLQASGRMSAAGLIACTPLTVRNDLVETADRLGIEWCTTEDLHQRAAAAVADIVNQVEVMRQSGALSDLNARYKTYRQQQIAKGEKAKPYSAFLNDFTTNMVTLAAQHAPA